MWLGGEVDVFGLPPLRTQYKIYIISAVSAVLIMTEKKDPSAKLKT